MTITEIIEMLRRRVANLQANRAQAAQIGDLERVTALDSEIAVTQTTLSQIESL